MMTTSAIPLQNPSSSVSSSLLIPHLKHLLDKSAAEVEKEYKTLFPSGKEKSVADRIFRILSHSFPSSPVSSLRPLLSKTVKELQDEMTGRHLFPIPKRKDALLIALATHVFASPPSVPVGTTAVAPIVSSSISRDHVSFLEKIREGLSKTNAELSKDLRERSPTIPLPKTKGALLGAWLSHYAGSEEKGEKDRESIRQLLELLPKTVKELKEIAPLSSKKDKSSLLIEILSSSITITPTPPATTTMQPPSPPTTTAPVSPRPARSLPLSEKEIQDLQLASKSNKELIRILEEEFHIHPSSADKRNKGTLLDVFRTRKSCGATTPCDETKGEACFVEYGYCGPDPGKKTPPKTIKRTVGTKIFVGSKSKLDALEKEIATANLPPPPSATVPEEPPKQEKEEPKGYQQKKVTPPTAETPAPAPSLPVPFMTGPQQALFQEEDETLLTDPESIRKAAEYNQLRNKLVLSFLGFALTGNDTKSIPQQPLSSQIYL